MKKDFSSDNISTGSSGITCSVGLHMENKKSATVILLLASAAGFWLWWIFQGDKINGDEAVVGLMALKISQGKDFPFFFWAAHYGGPLSSYLAAPLHAIAQPSAAMLHLVLLPFHISYVLGIYHLGRFWLDKKEAFYAGLCAALPFPMFPYSPLGGYTEAMAFFPWIILIFSRRYDRNTDDKHGRYFLGGILSAFALWVMPISVPVIIACYFYIFRRHKKNNLYWAITGLLLGLVPVGFYNIIHPGATILRLLSRPVHMDQSQFFQMLSNQGIHGLILAVLQAWSHAVWVAAIKLPHHLMLLFGIKDEISFLLVAGVISFIGLLSGFWFCLRWETDSLAPRILAMTALVNVGFVILFGMKRYRYLVPSLILVPFGLAFILNAIQRLSPRLSAIGLFIILLCNGIVVGETHKITGNNFSQLALHLEKKRMNYGYADYFVAYPLIYLSAERLIYTPKYHTPSADRYSLYTQKVDMEPDPVFIFREPQKVQLFEKKIGLKFRKKFWQNYIICRKFE